MTIDRSHPVFRLSELTHYLVLFATLWLLMASYIELDLLLQLYGYIFGDINGWFIQEYIGMRSDMEIAYFYMSSCTIFVLHANLMFMYSVSVDLKDEWRRNRVPLATFFNKNLWGRFWPHYAVNAFRLRKHDHEQELKVAVIKLIRSEASIDLPVSMLLIVISYPFLYSRLDSGGFLSIVGWQFLTLIALMLLVL